MRILIAGFGGQGVLFVGKFLAYCGMMAGHEVTWLPSYGPEMRGGTANCSVIFSDKAIGSPIIDHPDVLMAMNLPSLDKFEEAVVKGAKIIVDSDLIPRELKRQDVDGFYIHATTLAEKHGLKSLSNMVLVGKMLAATGLFTMEQATEAMKKTVPERKKELFAKNLEAIGIGMNG